MRVLLDSHYALWLVYEPERISERVRRVLEHDETDRLLSDVTLLELTLKLAKGKLEYTNDLQSFLHHLDDLAADPLPIRREHIVLAASLPRLHGDPFDRLLIAQAKLENAVLVTDDSLIRYYDVQVL